MQRRRAAKRPSKPGLRREPATQAEAWTLRALLVPGHAVRFARNTLDTAGIEDLLGRELDAVGKMKPSAAVGLIQRRLKALTRCGVVREIDVFANTARLAEALELKPAEAEVLSFAVVLANDEQLGEVVKPLLEREVRCFGRFAKVLASILTLDADEVRQALSAKGMLARSGLVRYQPDTSLGNGGPFEIPEYIRLLLQSASEDSGDILSLLLPRAPNPTLTREDFRHMDREAALLSEYLKNCLATKRKGVNVLLHGDPGKGKTELSRVLGREVADRVFEVAIKDRDGNALSGDDRLTNFLLGQSLACRGGPALILFDEAEDVFPDGLQAFFHHSAASDKAFTNRLLEENPVPAVWISNRIDHIDPAFLRRFDLILEVAQPSRCVRERILADRLESIPHEQAWLSRLVRDDRATPADLDRAAKVVRTLGCTDAQSAQACVEQILDMNLRARLGRKPATYRHEPSRYDLGLVNTSVSLPSLVSTLNVRRRGTACLYGAPGTGKTAFVHQVGIELGLPVVLRRGSDLLSMWVGGTEQNIAQMFQEARDEGAVLLLDEADSFLRDRRMARQSWEVTQVNELLVQMEAFDGIFFCSTNLIDDFDRAAFRRFALKVRFDPLKVEQRRLMFRRLMDRLQPGADTTLDVDIGRLDRLEGLTPGDFMAVEGRYELLGQHPTAPDVVEALTEELAVRSERRSRPLGFCAR